MTDLEDKREDYKAKLHTQICNAVKGNGIDTNDITIERFDFENLSCQATISIQLEPTLNTFTKPGKLNFPDIVTDVKTLPAAAQGYADSIGKNEELIEKVKKTLTARDDKGINLTNEIIKIPALNKQIAGYEPCPPCGGTTKTTCPKCSGKGRENCPRCGARGTMICPVCGGRQYIGGAGGAQQICNRCNGTGRAECNQCHQAKTIPCTQCQTRGHITCKICVGQGVQTVIANIEIEALTRYAYDESAIPEDTLELLNSLGENIQNHADIKIIPIDQTPSSSKITLDYAIKAPNADVVFKLGEHKVKATMFGKQSKIFNCPPFLETIMDDGIKALKAAAHGKNIEKNIKAAGHYKTLRLILRTNSKYTPKKAFKIIMQKTPLGLSQKTTKGLCMASQNALASIGKKSKLYGYGIGAGIAILGFAIFYILIRPMIPQYEMPAMFAAIIIALAIAYITATQYIRHAKLKSLEKLFGTDKK